MKSLQIFFLILFIGQFCFTTATICPSFAETAPCYCDDGLSEDPRKIIQCFNGTTEETLENLLRILRDINNVSASNPLSVLQFSLQYSSVKILNLTSFAHFDFEDVIIMYNHEIVDIVENKSPDTNQFRTGLVLLQQTGLTDETAARLLSFIESDSLKKLVILGSEVHGSAANSNVSDGNRTEFIKGLSKFNNLEEFRIEQSGHVPLIAAGQFQRNNRLTEITFMNVNLSQVRANAFLVENTPNDLKDVKITINLGFNQMTQDSFSVDHGLLSSGRPLFVYMEGNKFEFLPKETFENVLLADERHFLDFEYNQFVCDDRMQWLRDGKQRYQTQVKGVKCTNDPGKDIFTTALLP